MAHHIGKKKRTFVLFSAIDKTKRKPYMMTWRQKTQTNFRCAHAYIAWSVVLLVACFFTRDKYKTSGPLVRGRRSFVSKSTMGYVFHLILTFAIAPGVKIPHVLDAVKGQRHSDYGRTPSELPLSSGKDMVCEPHCE